MAYNGAKNMKPQSERTKSEQKEIAALGGIASGEARRKKSRLRDLLEIALDVVKTREKGASVGKDLSGDEYTVARLMDALENDDDRIVLRAVEIIRDTRGEKPTERMMIEGDETKITKISIEIADGSVNDDAGTQSIIGDGIPADDADC